jgi:Flp pilus assembly pilin Flp
MRRYNKGEKEMLNLLKNFIKEEDGLGTVEIVVIIAVLVGIALIFRDAIIKFVTDIMKSVFADDSITNDINSINIREQNRVN